MMIWLELCTTYSSSCHHHFRHPLLQSGFLCRPWIQGRPWKVLKFHKTENVLELFWKTSGRSWNFFSSNLPMWNLVTSLWELPAIVAIKLVEELLRPLIINKRHARMLQISVFFSQISLGLYAVEWSTGTRPWIGLELLNEKALKSLEFFMSSVAGTLFSEYQLTQVHLENGH